MPARPPSTPITPEHKALAKQRRARLIFLLALTAVNIWFVIDGAPVLYHASAGHPVGLVMVAILFGTLLVSLARMWFSLSIASRETPRLHNPNTSTTSMKEKSPE